MFYYICYPFAALLRLFYIITDSYGLSLILFTLVVKLVMMPFQMKSKKSMVRMNRMNGQIQEIQKKYANNQAKMSEELQKFYAEEGVNPMGGCLWSFLPLPILIALYSIIRQPITRFMMIGEETLEKILRALADANVDLTGIVQMKDGVVQMTKEGLTQLTPYGQINLVKTVNQMPEILEGLGVEKWIDVNYNFLGLNLTTNPWDVVKNFTFEWAVIGLILIPILAGGSQMFMSWYTMRTQNTQGPGASSTKTMMYMMPLMSVYIAFIMPAALGVYWIAQSVFSLIQEVIMTKFFTKKMEEEEDARFKAREEDRKRRQEEAKRLQEERKNQGEQKQSLREKRAAAEAAKVEKAKKAGTSTTEAGRVDDRPYARGRSYKADRYED